MKTILAVLLLAAGSALAEPTKSEACLVCPEYTVCCGPDASCGRNLRCPASPKMLCQLNIAWPEDRPSASYFVTPVEQLPAWCDRAGAELAVAAALAKLLGAPPYPPAP